MSRFVRAASFFAYCSCLVVACAKNDATLPTYDGPIGSDDGDNASGGAVEAIETGGAPPVAVGGSADGGTPPTSDTATGGESTLGSGGTAATGGVAPIGGAPASGGELAVGGGTASGGTLGSGGSPPTGGTTATGGTPATGGDATTGGTTGVAGSIGGAGAPSSAGDSGVGGDSPTGGTTSTGGDSGTGGTPEDEVCVWEDGPSATNGALTCYWFKQGTAQDQTTCPGGYKTYCGYCGSETGEQPQGDGQVWCPINDIVSTIANISTEHFVAIPPTPLAVGQNCGMCVEVTYRGRSIIATVVDSCPSCTSDQHIDLNLSAAKALGMTEEMGQVPSGVTWRSVGCPTTGDIQVSFNGGYQGQVYFQNAAFPIATAESGGRQATVNTGFWDFGQEMGGKSVTLTDVMGHTVTGTVPTSPGSLGVQFDLTCE